MSELTVPQIDFSSLGQLPQIWKQGQQDALRQQTLANLGQGGQVDANTLLRSGDLSLAQLGINLRNRQEDQARQATQDTRQTERDKVSDTHQKFMEGIATRQANRADEDRFAIKEVTDPNTGATTFVRIKTTGGEGAINTGVAPSTPNNPFGGVNFKNNEQAKSAGFTDRMLQSEAVLAGSGPGQNVEGPPTPGVQGTGTDFVETQLSNARDAPVVGKFANYSISNDRQKFNQAKADFINAKLRQESGAAISKDEFVKADQQYFPVPGDGPDVVKQKAANRRAAVESMGRESGPAYRPKSVISDNGAVVPYGQPPGRPAGNASIPPQAIEALRANPQLRIAFEAKYGAGSAASALGGQ